MNKYILIDYIIIDDTLCVTTFHVAPHKRRKGIGSNAVKDLEFLARQNACKSLTTASDLSKMALNFWLKNKFVCVDKNDFQKINTVLSSSKEADYIFDLDNNSVVELFKPIE